MLKEDMFINNIHSRNQDRIHVKESLMILVIKQTGDAGYIMKYIKRG